MTRRVGALVLTALLCGGPPVRASIDEDDEFVEYELLLFEEEVLVSAASRKVQKLSEAPGTVAVIDSEDFEAFGILTLGDALRYVTSINLVPQNQSLGAEIRGVRQPFSNKVLLLRDGRILNSVYRGNFYLDLSQSMEDVERIEIVRGPGSALYGANALAGFVNLVTRGGEAAVGSEWRAGVDDSGLLTAYASHGLALENGHLVFRGRALGAEPADLVNGGETEHRDARFDLTWTRKKLRLDFGLHHGEAGEPGTFALPTPGNEALRRGAHLDVTQQWTWGVDKKARLRSYLTHENNVYREVVSDLNLGTITPGWLFSNALFITDEAGTVIAEPTRELLDGRARAGAADLFLDLPGYQALLSGNIPRTQESFDSRERSYFTEFQFDWEITENHYFLAGVSAKIDSISHDAIGDETFTNYAAFIEDEWRFFDSRMIVLASVRFDEHDRFGSSFSPRVSFIGVPHERLAVKASYGTAFRSPNFVELFADTHNGILSIFGNPDLEQESIVTRELQLDIQVGKQHRLAMIGYDYDIDNEVVLRVDRRDLYLHARWEDLGPFPPFMVLASLSEFQGVPTSATFINGRGTHGRGFEATMSGSVGERFSYDANYAWLDAERPVGEEFVPTGNRIDRLTGQVLPGPVNPGDIPELVPVLQHERFQADSAAVTLRWRTENRWSFAARAKFASAQDRTIFDLDGTVGKTVDLTAQYRRKSYTFSATVLNALGSEPLPGRFEGGLDAEPSLLFLVRRSGRAAE